MSKHWFFPELTLICSSSLPSPITKGKNSGICRASMFWISFSFHYRKQECRLVLGFELENENTALDTTTAFFTELPTSDSFSKVELSRTYPLQIEWKALTFNSMSFFL
jgi:hypothetical protein